MDFYPGIYVELRTGVTGYVQNIREIGTERVIEISILTPASDKGVQEAVHIENTEFPAKYFAQIGDDRLPPPAIEPVMLDPYSSPKPWYTVQKKLNELVDAVNKINEQLKER